MTVRTITRYAVDCDFCDQTFDDSVCPDTVGASRAKVVILALAAGWEAVSSRRHRCPTCRSAARTEAGTIGGR